MTLLWEAGNFELTTRGGLRESAQGLVEEQRRFALHVRDAMVELTHVPSGRRIAMQRTLYRAAVIAEHLVQKVNVDWFNANPQLTEQQTEDIRFYCRGA